MIDQSVLRDNDTWIEPIAITDVGNGVRFAQRHGGRVKYSHVWNKWIVWNGRFWELDAQGEVVRLAKETARSIFAEAAQFTDKETQKRYCAWARRSQSRERISAMLEMAESEQPIPLDYRTLDSDGWQLNCDNGTVDLKRDGKLCSHRPEDFITKSTGVEYPCKHVEPTLWLEFLSRIFDNSEQLIAFVQRLCGMSLVGEVRDHVLPIPYGTGANGKSVFVETWMAALGDYAQKAPRNFGMVAKGDRHPTELADLHGARLVVITETGESHRLDEPLIKELTGGDTIKARRMKENFWQFKPSHTCVMVTNHKPTVTGTDNGIWRRLRIVPFVVTIPEAEQDSQLAEKLRGELPAILRWMVQGCLAWQRDGLAEPEEVLLATQEYKTESDTIAQFVEEECVILPDATVSVGDLYGRYKKWTENQGEKPMTQTAFGTRISDRFERKRTSRRRYYQGIGLAADDSVTG